MIVSAWLASASRWQRVLMATAVALALLVIVVVFLPLTPAYDVQVFLRAGHAVLHGLPVYPRLGSPAVYSGSSFVYPYLASWPFVPLAALPTDVGVAVFFLASVAAVLAAAIRGGDDDVVKVVAVLLTAYTITGLQLGSLSPLLFAGAVFMWRWREKPWVFGVLAALTVASKVFLAPLLFWPLLARRYGAFGWASACTALILLIGFLVGPLDPVAYATLLSDLGSHEASSGFSLTGAFTTSGLSFTAAELAAAAAAAVVLLVAFVRFRRGGGEPVLFAGTIGAALIASPVVWSHYLVLLAAALFAVSASRRWFLALAVGSWIMSPPHGLSMHVQASQSVPSHGAWLALAIVLGVFLASARGVPGARWRARRAGTLTHRGA